MFQVVEIQSRIQRAGLTLIKESDIGEKTLVVLPYIVERNRSRFGAAG